MGRGVPRVCPAPREIIGMCTPGAISTVGTAATAATKAACITRMLRRPGSGVPGDRGSASTRRPGEGYLEVTKRLAQHLVVFISIFIYIDSCTTKI